jgi:tetratricopeptide (TPR) repeat protein
MKKGDFAAAIDHLEDFSTDNDLVGPLATGLLGDAYSESGDIDKAASQYMKAAGQSKNKLTSPIFLKKAGIAFEELKNYGKAADAYEKIKKDYSESQEAGDIDKYIARAKAMESEGEHLEARQCAREAEPRHIRRSLGEIILAHGGRLRTPALLQAEPRERALGENARQVE